MIHVLGGWWRLKNMHARKRKEREIERVGGEKEERKREDERKSCVIKMFLSSFIVNKTDISKQVNI